MMYLCSCRCAYVLCFPVKLLLSDTRDALRAEIETLRVDAAAQKAKNHAYTHAIHLT